MRDELPGLEPRSDLPLQFLHEFLHAPVQRIGNIDVFPAVERKEVRFAVFCGDQSKRIRWLGRIAP